MTYHLVFFVAFVGLFSSLTTGCQKNTVPMGFSKVTIAKPAPAPPKPNTKTTGVKSKPMTPSVLSFGKSGLPAIADKTKHKDATVFNRKGLKAHRAKEYAKAAKLFEEAVKKDPGFILARYNLACALALNKQKKRSLAVLLEFKKAACPMCLRKLIGAPYDKDFASLKQDKQFMAVTNVDLAKIRKGGVKAAARALESAHKTGNLSRLHVWWPGAGKVKYLSYSTRRDDVPAPKLTSVKTIEKDIKMMTRFVREGSTFYGFGKKMACNKKCCHGKHLGTTHHGAERLEKVCVDKQGAISLFISYSD